MRKPCISIAIGLPLALGLSCGNSHGDNAATCGAEYNLGCIGDGREADGQLPKTSCARESYTYFRLDMTTSASTRSQIASCSVAITDPPGAPLLQYDLPAGQYANGTTYGCVLGQTSATLGKLSYSSCCAANQSLTFTLFAYASDGTILQAATASGPCTRYEPTHQEVPISLNATDYP